MRLAGATAERLNADTWQVASTLGLAAESLAVDRGAVLVGFPGEDAAARSLRLLVEAGLPVAEFAPAQCYLEHTFLALGHPLPLAATTPPPPPPAAPHGTEAGA